MNRKRIRKYRITAAGFTLMEVTIAMIIIGIAVVSLMALFGAGTEVNAEGNDLSTAVFLIDQIRAMTDQLEFYPLLFNYYNRSFNGVDAEGNPIPGLEKFQQRVQVRMINPEDMTYYMGSDPEAALVTASVWHEGKELARASWMRIIEPITI